jgi:anaerobic selenocysteine-containing dehydrogenase
MCPITVLSKDGTITAVEPNDFTYFPNVAREDGVAKDIDFVKGRVPLRPCARIHALTAQLYSSDRILYPMKRAPGSKRGDPNGQFVRITWGEAADTFAEKVKYYKEKYGPQSIIFCQINGGNTEVGRLLSFYDAE